MAQGTATIKNSDESTKNITRNIIGALFAISIAWNMALGIGIPWAVNSISTSFGWNPILGGILTGLAILFVGVPRALKVISILVNGPKKMTEAGL